MNPAQIIALSKQEGVRLKLSESGTIKAKGDKAHVDKWLPAIREQKAGIVALLAEAANDVAALTHYGWLITLSDQTRIYASYSPEANRAEVLRSYPGSLDAVPSKGGGVYVFPDLETPVYTQIDVDDRIICRQCQHRTYAGICNVAKCGAKPNDLGFASLPDLPQRCAGFASKLN